jgi:AraC-like DNA-binding protein
MALPDSRLALVKFFGALQVTVLETVADPRHAGPGRFAALGDLLPTGLASHERMVLKAVLALHLARWSTTVLGVQEAARRDLWAMLSADSDSLHSAYRNAVASLVAEPLHRDRGPAMPIKDERVAAALRYIDTHCANPALCLDEVAHAVCVSRWHLEHLLKKHTGIPFTRHLMRARLIAARAQLRNPALSVKEVAAGVGYAHVSQFTRHFRAAFNVPPGAWRRAARV